MSIIAYTDGACRGNPGPGGWGVILIEDGDIKKIKGFEPMTTNNRMELAAAIFALKSIDPALQVDLHTDSQYLRKGITEWVFNWQKRGWLTASKKPVKNVDLWKELLTLTQDRKVNWHWVKGHSGDQYNEMADLLANEAIDVG